MNAFTHYLGINDPRKECNTQDFGPEKSLSFELTDLTTTH